MKSNLISRPLRGAVRAALALALALALAALPRAAMADSGSSVSLSTSVSLAMGSVSGSLTTSSEASSSSGGGRQAGRTAAVVAGDYTVQAVDPAAAAEGLPRVAVQLRGPQALTVTMPQAAAAASDLGPGVTVQVAARAWGLALGREAGGVTTPFFLILDDHRHAELLARAVAPASR